MSRIIKMKQQDLEEIKKDFDEALKTLKMADGKINFTKTFRPVDRKATLFFTDLAYLKMSVLVKEFDKEVAWHGIAKRGEDTGKDEYVISDILVYPQEVTGSTVTTNQEKYQDWLMSNDDEVFNNIRMQGHSHVNMGTTPSSVDNSLYERILDQLEDDMFYIFLIWHKRGDKTIKIYDLAKNILFETSDVTVKILGVDSFLEESKEMVKDKVYAPTITKQPGYYVGYGTYTEKKGEDKISKEPECTSSVKKKRKKKKAATDLAEEAVTTGAADDDYYSWYKNYYGRG